MSQTTKTFHYNGDDDENYTIFAASGKASKPVLILFGSEDAAKELTAIMNQSEALKGMFGD
jgi:hypothetical protein